MIGNEGMFSPFLTCENADSSGMATSQFIYSDP